MYRHVFVYAFVCVVIISGRFTSAELPSAGSKDLNATCIGVGDCPTDDEDCKENCGRDKRMEITPTTNDNKTNDLAINMTLTVLMLSLNETEAAELSLAGSKDLNATCIDVGDCPTDDEDCKEKCGCDKRMEITPTTNDNTTYDYAINMTVLMLSLKETYNTEGRIGAEADKIFKGIIVAAFFFIACASVCTLTACIYCCRINYTDYQLKRSISVLAKKVGKKSQMKKRAEKEPTAPMAESCNVVVEDAGIFCV